MNDSYLGALIYLLVKLSKVYPNFCVDMKGPFEIFSHLRLILHSGIANVINDTVAK